MKTVGFVLQALLAYWISGVVHELGHVIVGLAYGWKFHLLVVGPLGLKADEQGKVRFYLEKQPLLWGGIGAALPRDAKADNLKVWNRVLLAGPLASIIMGLIFLPLGVVTDNLFLILLGAMPLGMGAVCALPLPLKTGITYTDGGRWSRLRRGGQAAAEEVALFRLTETNLVGGSYHNQDLEHIHSLTRSKEAGIRYYGYYHQYRYYQARGNAEEMLLARQQMDELKSQVSSIIVEDCKLD